MSAIPKDWIEAGARAIPRSSRDDPDPAGETAEAVLAAALPLIRGALADAVMDAIIPSCGPVLDPFDGCGHRADGMRRAASLIRGGAL